MRNPKIILDVTNNFRRDIFDIHIGNFISGVSTELGGGLFRNFYIWGGKNIIEIVSSSANVQASETSHGFGTYGRGGSQNNKGITLIDTIT